MDPSTLIPAPDPIPVDWGWMQFLLTLTFILHLLFMNTMLGSSVIALVEHIKNRKGESLIAKDVSGKLPFTIAFTVNLGVAPLLFVQVLYGHFMYTSSILIGVWWLSVIALLIVAYYSAYYYGFKCKGRGQLGWIPMALTSSLFMIIAFIYTNNMTLMIQPDRWTSYFSNRSGTILNLTDPTLIPRYLHFIIASLAIGGLAMALYYTLKSKRHSEESYQKQIQTGMKWFAHSTLLQIGIGLWFFLVLPKHIIKLFMGGNMVYTCIFGIGLILGIGLVIVGYKKKVMASVVMTITTVTIMVVMRDFVRSGYLGEYFTLGDLTVNAQYSPMVLFLVTFVIGLAIVFMMLKWGWEAVREVRS